MDNHRDGPDTRSNGPGYIKMLADQEGKTVEQFIDEQVQKYRTPGRIAQMLGCNPSAVRKHLIRLGYQPFHDIRWKKAPDSTKI